MLHIFRSLRQFHVKAGGAFFVAGNPYFPGMALGNLLCHHQPESRTVLIAVIAAPVEFIKYVLPLFLRHSDPCIFHRYQDLMFCFPDIDPDLRILICIFDSILQKDQKQLADLYLF